MLARVFAPDLDPTLRRTELSAEESAHLTRVLRLRAGALVLVFDGRGAQHLAEIATATRSAVTLKLLEPATPARETRVRLALAQAALKGDKMDTVVRDATMMGVSAVHPIVTSRTVVPLSTVEEGRVMERWRRVAVASAKQCGRAVVPTIAPPCRFEELVPDWGDDSLRLMLVEPSAGHAWNGSSASNGTHDEGLPAEPPHHVLVVIGPEGGWSPEEMTMARDAGFRPWTLGERTLRAESAPLAALSVLTYVWRL
jgi:16S rRNA (uracil1498-N3)-methyltransferase